MMSFTDNGVILCRVGGREPKLDIPLELVTCNGGLYLVGNDDRKM